MAQVKSKIPDVKKLLETSLKGSELGDKKISEIKDILPDAENKINHINKTPMRY